MGLSPTITPSSVVLTATTLRTTSWLVSHAPCAPWVTVCTAKIWQLVPFATQDMTTQIPRLAFSAWWQAVRIVHQPMSIFARLAITAKAITIMQQPTSAAPFVEMEYTFLLLRIVMTTTQSITMVVLLFVLLRQVFPAQDHPLYVISHQLLSSVLIVKPWKAAYVIQLPLASGLPLLLTPLLNLMSAGIYF